MRIAPTWVIAFLGVSLAGVLVDAVRVRPTESLHDALATVREVSMRPAVAFRAPMPDSGASPFRATPLTSAIVLQLADCESNFRMMNLLHRRDTRDAVRLAVMWYVGPDGDSTRIRRLLPPWTAAVPLQRLPSAVQRELGRLGHHTSPILVVLDDDGRIRLTTQSPRTAREFAGLQRIITGLTWSDDR